MHATDFRSNRLPIFLAATALALGLLSACGPGQHDDAHMDHDAAMHEEVHDAAAGDEQADAGMAMDGAPRVFFTNVADGDEVTSPVHLEFDVENFEIIEAHDPAVIEEGKGHHHLAVNGDCEEPGVVLPKAAPWIHFGDASNTIDVQLPPGKARLTLQVGDGEHRTLDEPGLCNTIEVTVVEGDGSEGEMAGDETAE